MQRYIRLGIFLCQLPLASLAMAQTGGRTLIQVNSQTARAVVPWDGGRAGGIISIVPRRDSEFYAYCKHQEIERNRDPRERPPADDYSGYRIIESKPQMIAWQWWVMPWRRWANKRNHSLDVDFEVTWILKTSTQQERIQNGCNDLPPKLDVRTWPVEPDPSPPVSTPTAPLKYLAVLRLHCVEKGSSKSAGILDIERWSPTSCGDAKTGAVEWANNKDRCEFGAGVTYPHMESGKREWVATGSCP